MNLSKNKGKEIAVLWLVMVVATSMIAGCGGTELYILNHRVLPTGLDSAEVASLQADTVDRQHFYYEEPLRKHRIQGHPGLYAGIPLLTWRFGGQSSEYAVYTGRALDMRDLGKHLQPSALSISKPSALSIETTHILPHYSMGLWRDASVFSSGHKSSSNSCGKEQLYSPLEGHVLGWRKDRTEQNEIPRDTRNSLIGPVSTYATLTGKTYSGEAIEGWDEITIVPTEK